MNLTETKRLLLRAVAFCLSAEQIKALREGFEHVDEDKNGTISMAELRAAFETSQFAGKQFSYSKDDIDQVRGCVCLPSMQG